MRHTIPEAERMRLLFWRLDMLDQVQRFAAEEQQRVRDEIGMAWVARDKKLAESHEIPKGPARIPRAALACVRALRWAGGTAHVQQIADRARLPKSEVDEGLIDAKSLGLVEPSTAPGCWAILESVPRELGRTDPAATKKHPPLARESGGSDAD